jgi:hypothetical protein
MCWSWIDSSRKREALTIPCPGPGIASLRRCKAGPGQKIAKTTPCKVEWTPARSTLAAPPAGREKKGLNLISSRSRIVSISFPCGVVVSAHASASEREPAPCFGNRLQRIEKAQGRPSQSVQASDEEDSPGSNAARAFCSAFTLYVRAGICRIPSRWRGIIFARSWLFEYRLLHIA